MSFQKEKIHDFLKIFNRSKGLIRDFPGCIHLELLQDADLPHVYCTYSHWTDEAALENYRQSPLFQEVWSETKKLFSDKPQAFSLYRVLE
jgi:hypothetical protein